MSTAVPIYPAKVPERVSEILEGVLGSIYMPVVILGGLKKKKHLSTVFGIQNTIRYWKS